MGFFNYLVKKDEPLFGVCVNKFVALKVKSKSKYTIHQGDLVKIDNRYNPQNHNEVLFTITTDTDKFKLVAPNISCFKVIEMTLYKYLLAIKDLAERVKIFKDEDRQQFLLNLTKGSIVSIKHDDEYHLALFNDLKEDDGKFRIEVEFMEYIPHFISKQCNKPIKKGMLWKFPANLILKPMLDVDGSLTEQTKWLCAVCHTKNIKDENLCKHCTSVKNDHSALSDTAQISGNYLSDENIPFVFNTSQDAEKSYHHCSIPAKFITRFDDVDEKIEQNLQIDRSKWLCSVCHIENLKDKKRCLRCVSVNDHNILFDTTVISHNYLSDSSSSFNSTQDDVKLSPSSDICFGLNSKSNYEENKIRTEISDYDKYNDIHGNKEKGFTVLADETGNSTTNHIYSQNQEAVSSNQIYLNSNSPNIETISTEGSQLAHALKHVKIIEWICLVCTTSNNSDQSQCSKCNEQNPKCKMKNISWTCTTCHTINTNHNNKCTLCGEEKEIIEPFKYDICKNKNLIVTADLIPATQFNLYEDNQRKDLVSYEDQDLMDYSNIVVVRNNRQSKCEICKNSIDPQKGFDLSLCKHTCCVSCIKHQMKYEKFKCLARINDKPCEREFELSEIKSFLSSKEYKNFRDHLISSGEANSYIQFCFNSNCNGYRLCEKYVEKPPREWTCEICKLNNCLDCTVSHHGLKCEQYRKLTDEKSVDKDTLSLLLSWIRDGIAMPCPECEELIEKDEGCDWVQCSFCNTEICWARRMHRWGPEGQGDTSGGCQCTKEKKCIETCNYCH